MNIQPWQFTATLIDGRRIELGAAADCRIISSVDSPVVSLEAQFPISEMPPLIHEVQAWGFSGFVDQQSAISSGGGNMLRVEARSAGRRLLDNEARPQVYYNASLRDIFSRHIAPYGFVLDEVGSGRLSVFAVGRGMCQWEVLTAFCRGLGRAAPIIRDENIVSLRPLGGGEPIVISNSGRQGELPFSSLQDTFKRFGVPSEIHITAGKDGRTIGVANPYAPQYKLDCTRFATPRAEFSHSPTEDAGGRISTANLGMRMIKAELPGLHDIAPGSGVRIDSEICREDGLIVWGAEKRQNASGAYTTLTLARKIFYKEAQI